ncbi:MAG: hypothetical protein IT245_01970 [Bacteroidia bacterium]|nr:hypothetical protein [Bacteroidia bacterium]
MKHFLLSIVTIFCCSFANSQEFGYITGANNLGYNAQRFQMLYGISGSKKFKDYFNLETGVFYSQRQYENEIQADYLSFYNMFQFGTFKEKYGIYAGPIVALNPTLHHSNIENHTYVSAGLGLGGRLLLVKKVWADARIAYDKGLTGAYFKNNTYQNYDGLSIFLGLKFDFSCN